MTVPKDTLYKAGMLIGYLAKKCVINYFHDESEIFKC